MRGIIGFRDGPRTFEDASSQKHRPTIDETRAQWETVLRASCDQAPYLAGILDLDGTFRHANRAAYSLMDQEPGAIIGRPFWEAPGWTMSEDEQEKLRDGVRRSAQEAVQFESTFRATDGTLRIIDVTLRPVHDDTLAVWFLLAEGREVTKRKRLEEALRSSEVRYRALVESQVDMISRYLPDTTLTFVNDAYCQFYGRTREELIGRSFLTMVAPEFHEVILKETQDSAQQARTTMGEYLNYTQNGEVCWIHWIIRGIVDEDDRVVELQAVGRDVTPLKKAQEALRQANLVVESSPVVLFRRKAADGWPIVYVSQNVVQFGYAPQELLLDCTAYIELVHPEDADRVVREVQEYSASGVDHFQREYRIFTKDRRVRWVDDRVAVERDAEGRVTHYQSIVIDITERKNAEIERSALQNQLQQAMKMEAVGRLAGGVAHDFNNLLTAISGNLDLAQMELSPTEPVLPYLEEASKAAARAASLTRQLLTFSRRQIIEPRILNLNVLVNNLRMMLVRVIGEHIKMDFVSEPDLGSVKVDSGQFEQVLMNLAVNARDAMPNGGSLLIETANVELDQEYCSRYPHVTAGSFVRLSVSDTGHGMSDDAKQHLFEPFYTTKPKGTGTGLGLAVIFGIVKQSGGTIDVCSEVGEGTTLRIYLPRVCAQAAKLTDATCARQPPHGNETILLVEDDASVRELAKSFLERLGYTLFVANDGHSAIKLFEEYGAHIHLLLTDVVMPGMNGRELAARLLKVRPQTKVLYSSGYAEDVIVHHSVIDEQVNFIGKPYSIQTLGDKVRAALDQDPISTSPGPEL